MNLAPSQIVEIALKLDKSIALCMIGSPGIGKSATGKNIASAMGPTPQDPRVPVCVVRELCAHLPEDLVGAPFFRDGFTHFAPPAFLGGLADKKKLAALKAAAQKTIAEVGDAVKELAAGSGPDGTNPKGVLLLDDFTQSQRMVQNACLRLVQSRAMNDVDLSPDVRIVITGNRTQDQAGARELYAPMKNRVCRLDLAPDLEEWMTWAAGAGLPALCGSFLQWKPEYFSQLVADCDKENGQYATPRSWHNVGLAILSLGDVPEEILHAVAGGLVGNGIATELIAFRRLQKELPNPKAVLEDPVGALPNPPKQLDRKTALVTALGEFASKEQEKDKAIHLKLILALAHVAGKSGEAIAAGLTVFQCNGGNVAALFDAAQANKQDPRVKALIKHFAASVS